jgi:plastocyanin
VRFAPRNLGFLGVAAIVAATLWFFAPARASTETGKVHIVTIQGMRFDPAKLEIAPGDSVKWVNNDILMHAAKSADPKNVWQSKDLKPHDSWSKVFQAGGSYFCPYHPTMTGEIIVRGKAGG